jgi:CPA2 family monovalent cation:H+ antiporter-2
MNVIYGDAANPVVLETARIHQARLLAILVPNVTTAQATTQHARALNPSLDIVARVSRAEDIELFQQAGATQLVQPEFEAGVEVIRYALRRYGVLDPDLSRDIANSRQAFYSKGGAP